MQNKISLNEAISYLKDSPVKWIRIFSWIGILMVFSALDGVLSFFGMVPFLAILLFPVRLFISSVQQVYQYGYMYEVAQIARNKGKEIPDVFAGIQPRFMKGLSYWLISFVYGLPLLVLIAGATTAFIFPSLANPGFYEDLSTEASLILALIVIITVAMFLVLAVITGYFASAAIYRYLNTAKLAEAFNLRQVFEIIQKGFKAYLDYIIKSFILFLAFMGGFTVIVSPLLLVAFIAPRIGSDAGSPMAFVALLVVCCLFIPVFAAIFVLLSAFAYFLQPHLIGQLFRVWDANKLDKV